jgi:hypothetical protein
MVPVVNSLRLLIKKPSSQILTVSVAYSISSQPIPKQGKCKDTRSAWELADSLRAISILTSFELRDKIGRRLFDAQKKFQWQRCPSLQGEPHRAECMVGLPDAQRRISQLSLAAWTFNA